MSVTITNFAHGTTIDNESGVSSGWSDVELSKLGIQQSKDLMAQTTDKDFAVVYCSDLKRSIDSANLAWGGKYKIIEDARLRECNYGDFNGKPSEIVEPMQVKAIYEPMPNGESYEMVKERMARLLEDIKIDYDGKHVAMVGHKATQFALEVLLKGLSWEEVFEKDWRLTKSWQPGWEYTLD